MNLKTLKFEIYLWNVANPYAFLGPSSKIVINHQLFQQEILVCSAICKSFIQIHRKYLVTGWRVWHDNRRIYVGT